MTSLIFVGLLVSSFLYLDLPFILSMPVISFLVFSFTLVFFISLWQPISQKINHICFEKKISGKDLLLILSTLISYIYFISQFFYHNFFQIISVYTDNVAHRLISKELLLNLSNSFALVHRNTTTGNIDITDIFYPLGFHSLIYFISELFSVSVDLVIYYLFLFLWTILIPLTIFYASLFLTNSFRIAFIFTIIFLSTSEILLQYYYLGLWPFMLGAVLSLFIIMLSIPLDIKRMLFITPLFLGLFIIYPSFAIIAFFIILAVKIPFTQLIIFLKKSLSCKIYVYIFVVFLFLTIIFYITNLYVNILIVANSVLKIDSLYNLDKFFDLDIHLINIQTRFFDLNSSRFLISSFAILTLVLYISSRDFRNFFPKKFFSLYIIFAVSLLSSLISGIIGIANYLINPLGILFYYDFNRIYILYLFFTILLLSYTLYYFIYLLGKTSLLFVFIFSLSLLQINSSFTARLNSGEIPVFDALKKSSTLNFNFFDEKSFTIDCNFSDQDPTFICFTLRGLEPQFFTNEVSVNTRTNFY